MTHALWLQIPYKQGRTAGANTPRIAPRIREHLLAHANPGPDGLLLQARAGHARPQSSA